MKTFDEFDVFVTVTGFNHYPNAKRLLEGDKVMLCREPENEFDKSAVSVYSEFGKIGYVANSEKTVRKGTISADRLVELIADTQEAVVTEGGYYEAICKVIDVYDIDKMIIKACNFYNEGEYESAKPLFLKIGDKYHSLLLTQYIADCFLKTGNYEDALEYSKRALELEENNKISLMMYATALHKLGKYTEAIEEYNKILSLSENKLVRDALNECIMLSSNEEK